MLPATISFVIPLGNFKQHVTCSTVTGIVLGGAGYYLGLPLPTCLLSAGLCGMAGMLPDIDSDTSRSFQECIYLAAGIAAVLTVQRLRTFGLEQDIILLGGAFMFLFVRFGVGEFVKKVTSHRGMFHSVPAAVFAGEIVFFLSTGTINERLFKAAGLTIGYLSHLILDEICSIDSSGRLKKSSGTAFKFIDKKKMPATLALYTLIISMGLAAVNGPEFGNSVIGQYASEKLSPKISEKAGVIKSELKNELKAGLKDIQKDETNIQREAAEYLAQTATVPVSAEAKPTIARPSVAIQTAASHDRNSEGRLFSRNRRRTVPIPVDTAEMEAAPITVASLPSPLPLPNWQPVQPESVQQPSPMQVSTPVFENRHYRNFALPSREPAPIILPSP